MMQRQNAARAARFITDVLKSRRLIIGIDQGQLVVEFVAALPRS
jgi:hypothetical protein